MPTGSCLCGQIRIAYTGDPVFTVRQSALLVGVWYELKSDQAICYCDDDRKMSSTQVWQIPKANFTVEAGELKTFNKVSDHGHDIQTHFCPTCGTAMYRTGGAASVQELIGLRVGVLDDQTVLNEQAPEVEVYVERRPTWISRISGATQLSSKYEILEHGAAG